MPETEEIPTVNLVMRQETFNGQVVFFMEDDRNGELYKIIFPEWDYETTKAEVRERYSPEEYSKLVLYAYNNVVEFIQKRMCLSPGMASRVTRVLAGLDKGVQTRSTLADDPRSYDRNQDEALNGENTMTATEAQIAGRHEVNIKFMFNVAALEELETLYGLDGKKELLHFACNECLIQFAKQISKLGIDPNLVAEEVISRGLDKGIVGHILALSDREGGDLGGEKEEKEKGREEDEKVLRG